MSTQYRKQHVRNRGVTLVELLIVILIMLMITAVTVPAISPALEGRKVREAARMVEVFLNGARNRAIASGHSVGVLIQPDDSKPSQCIALSYVEQPAPYSGDFVGSKIRILGNGGFGAWSAYPTYNAVSKTTVGAVASGASIFKLQDVGWLQNLAPGDLFTLDDDDTVLYRIFAGEPFIDVNGDGQFTSTASFSEPFNDVDGSGTYTPASGAPIDPITGYFTSFPQVAWGTESAFVTYTYADEAIAAKYMSQYGLNLDPNTKYTLPIRLSFDAHHAIPSPHSISFYDSVSNTVTGEFSFQFIRKPIESSSTKLNLPAGTCIDLGSNYVDKATQNIVGIPGSGLDQLVPFWNATPKSFVYGGQGYTIEQQYSGTGTLGFYASFRPNPLTDYGIVGASVGTLVHRPIMITFDPSGVVDMVYSWDEHGFIKNTSAAGPPSPATIIPGDYHGRFVTSPIYLLIGRTELIDGDPETLQTLASGVPPRYPIFNLQDPSSLWVSINPRTGLISTTENVPPDLTQAAPTTQTAANPQIQLYFNAQVYQARSFARQASDMGGM